MTYCPSHDWDRHVDELDAAELEKARFYGEHREAIVRVIAGLCANRDVYRATLTLKEGDIVDMAAELVRIVVERGRVE